MRKVLIVAAGLAVLAWAPQAMAAKDKDDPRMCNREAAKEFKECQLECREEFLTDKDACRNIDHDCANACRAERAACEEPYLDAVELCIVGCKETLEAAKLACEAILDPVERDQCIDDAQVAGFVCRDDCRENTTVDGKPWREGVQECRVAARACFEACPRKHN